MKPINIQIAGATTKPVLSEATIQKINEILEEVEKNAKVREFVSSDLLTNIAHIESRLKTLHIPKKEWGNLAFKINQNSQKFPKAYQGAPLCTLVEVQFKSSKWSIKSIYRGICTDKYLVCIGDLSSLVAKYTKF